MTDNSTDLEELSALCERLEIAVVREKLGASRGGLCRIYQRHVLYLDSALDEREQIEIMAQAVAQFDIDDFYVRPRLRELIARYRGGDSTLDEP